MSNEGYYCQPAMGTVWSKDARGMEQVQFGWSANGDSGPVEFKTLCGGALNQTPYPYKFGLSDKKPSRLTSYGNGFLQYDLHLEGEQAGSPSGGYRSVAIGGWGRVLQNESDGYAECFPRDKKVEVVLEGAEAYCQRANQGSLYPTLTGAKCNMRFWFDPAKNPDFDPKCAGPVIRDTVPLYIAEGSR